MITCEQLAIVLTGKPILGAHATSRTQSECPSKECSSFHPSSNLILKIIQKGKEKKKE